MHSKESSTIPEKSSRIAPLFERVLAASGAYLADKLYQFSMKGNSGVSLCPLNEEASSKAHLYQGRWLIVGREYYYETSKDYPIANKRDLQKALKFEQNSAPYAGIKFQHIERINEQTHRVTFWVVNPSCLTDLAINPWFVFPESYLISLGLDAGLEVVEVPRINNTLFISITGKRLTSGLQSPHIPNLSHFSFSTGSALCNENSRVFTQPSDFSMLIYNGLKALPALQWQNFTLKSQRQQTKQFPWKAASFLSGLVLTLYLLLTSGWLIYQQQHLQQQLQAESSQVNEALNLQKKYDKKKQWQAQLVAPLQQITPHWEIWPVAVSTIQVGAKVSLILYKNGEFRLNGETHKGVKATDVLAELSENPLINAPKFASPVRERRGQEKFAITFTFNTSMSSESGGDNVSAK